VCPPVGAARLGQRDEDFLAAVGFRGQHPRRIVDLDRVREVALWFRER
jgi:hypothetical protein